MIKLEDLGEDCILYEICEWLGIYYEDTLSLSSFGGIRWRGDSLSTKINQSKGFSKEMINNKWSDEFTFIEKYIFNFILNSRLAHYSYKYEDITIKDYFIVPMFILIPLKFEIDMFFLNFSSKYSFRNKIYFLRRNILGYLKRVILFYKYYYSQVTKNYFKSNLLTCVGKK